MTKLKAPLRISGVGLFYVLISTKRFAMLSLAKVVRQQYPELKEELRMTIEDQLPKSNATYKRLAEKVLEGLG